MQENCITPILELIEHMGNWLVESLSCLGTSFLSSSLAVALILFTSEARTTLKFEGHEDGFRFSNIQSGCDLNGFNLQLSVCSHIVRLICLTSPG